MTHFANYDFASINRDLKSQSPARIIQWALAQGSRPIISTNFRPYEAAILHAVSREFADIPVIWCDTGYNTSATYRHANQVIELLNLNIKIYAPLQTSAYRNVLFGGIPDIETSEHAIFTEQVKLEPFARAMTEHQADIWFSNLRVGQTELRNSLDIVSYDQGRKLLKISPFYHYDDAALDEYLQQNQLPNELDYYDPSKAQDHRECGLHR